MLSSRFRPSGKTEQWLKFRDAKTHQHVLWDRKKRGVQNLRTNVMVYCQEVKILRVLLTRSSAVSSMLKLLFRKTVRQPPSHASRGSNEGYDITKNMASNYLTTWFPGLSLSWLCPAKMKSGFNAREKARRRKIREGESLTFACLSPAHYIFHAHARNQQFAQLCPDFSIFLLVDMHRKMTWNAFLDWFYLDNLLLSDLLFKTNNFEIISLWQSLDCAKTTHIFFRCMSAHVLK